MAAAALDRHFIQGVLTKYNPHFSGIVRKSKKNLISSANSSRFPLLKCGHLVLIIFRAFGRTK